MTVLEYEEDELADNSDDEKRLFRAKARAGRKLKQKSIRNTKWRTQQWGGSRKPMRASWLGTALTGGEPAQSNAPASLVGILPQWHISKNAPQSARVQAHPSWALVTCVVNWDIIGRHAHCCWELTPQRLYNN